MAEQDVSGSSFYCPAFPSYVLGASYIFTPGGKREVEAPASPDALDVAPRGEGDIKCQQADTFFDVNGAQYDISALGNAQVGELVEFASNGTVVNYLEGVGDLKLRK